MMSAVMGVKVLDGTGLVANEYPPRSVKFSSNEYSTAARHIDWLRQCRGTESFSDAELRRLLMVEFVPPVSATGRLTKDRCQLIQSPCTCVTKRGRACQLTLAETVWGKMLSTRAR